jgi:amino acid transporter
VRRMGWFDGFVLALTIPAALIATLGFSIAALGAWAAIALWAISMLIAVAANWIYSEMAAMFPDKPGGIALYAHEGWRGRLALVGPIASFGYWFAWTGSLAVYGGIIGELVQARWFPGQDWELDAGLFVLTFPKAVAVTLLVAVWAANVLGLRPTLWVVYMTAAMLLVPVAVFVVAPYLTGDWSAESLSWKLGEEGQAWGGLKLALVWLYVMCWTSLGVETCATFTPEYRGGARDASRALRSAALFSLAVFVLLPLGAAGTAGEPAVAEEPVSFYASAFDEIAGGAADLMVVLIVGSLVLVMTTSMADGSRALYGIARDRMTVRELDQLNRRGVPSRAMTVDLVANLFLILVVGDILAILATGNLGYILAHVLALTGFLLLRIDRPRWPRPIRLGRPFVVAAATIAGLLLVLLVVGATSFDLTGYGGRKELWIAVGVLSSSLVLFVFRRAVQDRGPLALREEISTRPARNE